MDRYNICSFPDFREDAHDAKKFIKININGITKLSSHIGNTRTRISSHPFALLGLRLRMIFSILSSEIKKSWTMEVFYFTSLGISLPVSKGVH